jgi:hypothetical protein
MGLRLLRPAGWFALVLLSYFQIHRLSLMKRTLVASWRRSGAQTLTSGFSGFLDRWIAGRRQANLMPPQAHTPIAPPVQPPMGHGEPCQFCGNLSASEYETNLGDIVQSSKRGCAACKIITTILEPYFSTISDWRISIYPHNDERHIDTLRLLFNCRPGGEHDLGVFTSIGM